MLDVFCERSHLAIREAYMVKVEKEAADRKAPKKKQENKKAAKTKFDDE